MAHLAGVLRELREDAAMTQEDLAAKAEVSVRTVSDVERGLRKRIYRDTGERLGRALGLSGERLDEFVELARGRTTQLRRDLDEQFRRRFVAWHVDRVTSLADHVGSEEQWYAVLDADAPNLTVALRWAEEAHDTESMLQLATGLWRYWQARGELTAGRRWLERGLSASPPASEPTRTTALWGLAWLAFQQGDDATASRCAAELAALAMRTREAGTRRHAATVRGIVALADDDPVTAGAEFRDALRIAEELDQPWVLATSQLNLGIAAIGVGDTAAACVLLEKALRGYADVGDDRFRARSLAYLGLAALVERDVERAEALYAESLAVFDELGEPKGVAEGLTGLATAASMSGAATRAAQLAGAAELARESFAGRALPVERRLAEAELARAREAMPAAEWRAAWTAGRALRREDAIALALSPWTA